MHASYCGAVMKTRGKGKIFKCLRPATADEGYFKHSRSCDSFADFPEYSSSGSDHGGGGGRGGDGSSTAVVAAAGDPKILRHLTMRKATHADRSSDVDAPDDPNARKGKFPGKFRRVLKAVFFEASLLRKLRKTDSSLPAPFRSRSSSSTNLSSSSSKSKSQRMSRSESFASMGQTESSEKFSRINSSDSSSSRLSSSSMMTARELSSSSSLSPCPSVPRCSLACCLDRNRSISSRTKQVLQQKLERGRYCWKVGCCCLILCLLALLFWGKALAIVFISAWLYFAPLYFKSAIDPPPLFEPSESCMITSTRNRPRHARRHSGF
ncbi:uncharacterized protein LOC116011436 [Ipomoea triloba]|uniref:uncharacterized protein LOC116011436 n=1 Tax=Ipomoea triloba TaxID=35885 RepID=UPI00125E649E|nr:uncharacterized protein LOC116011436 [Ipomoea triloba]